jgi:transcriptional antiterminator NusG
MAKQVSRGKQWYVIHTYSGFEEQVQDALRQRIETTRMEDRIFDVVVPTEKKVKIKNGKRKTYVEKVFPGYVMVQMIVTDDSWYVVRNTPNVTGFLGSGTTPVPMSNAEVEVMLKKMQDEEPTTEVDLKAGDTIVIQDGPFKNFEGKVTDIDSDKGKIKVLTSMFGRETPVELDFLQVKKLT